MRERKEKGCFCPHHLGGHPVCWPNLGTLSRYCHHMRCRSGVACVVRVNRNQTSPPRSPAISFLFSILEPLSVLIVVWISIIT